MVRCPEPTVAVPHAIPRGASWRVDVVGQAAIGTSRDDRVRSSIGGRVGGKAGDRGTLTPEKSKRRRLTDNVETER